MRLCSIANIAPDAPWHITIGLAGQMQLYHSGICMGRYIHHGTYVASVYVTHNKRYVVAERKFFNPKTLSLVETRESIQHMATTTTSSPSSENKSQNPAEFLSNCLLLSSAFLRTPLTLPFPRHSKPNNNTNCIQDLHNSLTSTLDRCFRTLNSVAENNPIFQNLISLSDNFRNVFQIRCRKYSSSTSLSMHNFAAILPGDSVAGLVAANGLLNFLNIYNTLLVVRLVLTWFPNSPPAIVSPLSTLCDPYLNIFRGIIPPLGGTLDLSPILAFLVLNALTSTASALPAELPIEGQPQSHSSSHPKFLNLTIAQKKWMTRICGDRSKNSSSLN